MASEAGVKNVKPTPIDYRFNLVWQDMDDRCVSCVTQESVYSMNISYVNGKQTVETHVKSQKILTAIQTPDGFGGGSRSHVNDTITDLETQGLDVLEYFRKANILAVQDTLVGSLAGLVAQPSKCS